MPAVINLAFELTPGGLEEAQQELDRIRELLKGRGAHQSDRAAGEVVYRRCQGRSRALLQALPDRNEDAVTFAEIVEKMPRNSDGSTPSASTVRASYRNVKRVEKGLWEAGEIDREVIVVDYSGYGAEGANRYYLRPEDRAAIDELAENAE